MIGEIIEFNLFRFLRYIDCLTTSDGKGID